MGKGMFEEFSFKEDIEIMNLQYKMEGLQHRRNLQDPDYMVGQKDYFKANEINNKSKGEL